MMSVLKFSLRGSALAHPLLEAYATLNTSALQCIIVKVA